MDLKYFKTTVEKQSLRRGYKLHCHLMSFIPIRYNKQISAWQNRKHLRENLVQTIEQKYKKILTLEEKKNLLTPGFPPQLLFASISISHCAFLGGFVISSSEVGNELSLVLKPSSAKRQIFIGFDVEELGRAKEKTVLRISNQEELNKAPSPSALWSAKEAAYKSLSLLRKGTYIKDISIFDWQLVSSMENTTEVKLHISKTTDEDRKKPSHIYDYKFIIKEKNIKGEGTICYFKRGGDGACFF